MKHLNASPVLSVNAELIRLYWDIGRIIHERQQREGWGAGVIPRLAYDLQNEIPEVKGFSERNIKRMLAFYRAYADAGAIVPQVVAQLGGHEKVPQPAAQLPESLLWSLPWGHHALLLEKVNEPTERRWYMEQTLAGGWSRNILAMKLEAGASAKPCDSVASHHTYHGHRADLFRSRRQIAISSLGRGTFAGFFEDQRCGGQRTGGQGAEVSAAISWQFPCRGRRG